MLKWIKKTWGLRGWFAVVLTNWRNILIGKIRLWRMRRAGFTILRISSGEERYKRLVDINSRVVSNQGGQLRVAIVSTPKAEITTWLSMNASAAVNYMGREEEVMFMFKNPNDAVAFKMRWW